MLIFRLATGMTVYYLLLVLQMFFRKLLDFNKGEEYIGFTIICIVFI